MSKRLLLLNSQIQQNTVSYVDSAFQYLNFHLLLTPHQNDLRLKVRQFAQKQIIPNISYYVETAQFPEYLISKFRQVNILKFFIKPPYGVLISRFGQGVILAELSRADPSVATMFWLLVLNIQTILKLGSQQQIKKYIPKMMNLQFIGGWSLTQINTGSDASNIQCKVDITNDGYILNGNKKWIGNGNRDFLIVWARNSINKNIQAFLVNNSLEGVSSTPIKNKLAMRLVQNCQINFNNVKLSHFNKLQKANSFSKSTNLILKSSRGHVCWIAAGICLGVYDNVIKYSNQRKQFGVAISSFQLIQQKIVKIMSTTQAILLICWRLSQMTQNNESSIGQISIFKAWITDRCRQIVRLGRQILGGNGIIHDNYVMKALTDIEGIYTYQGTYQINVLVGGRQLTGISAIKK